MRRARAYSIGFLLIARSKHTIRTKHFKSTSLTAKLRRSITPVIVSSSFSFVLVVQHIRERRRLAVHCVYLLHYRCISLHKAQDSIKLNCIELFLLGKSKKDIAYTDGHVRFSVCLSMCRCRLQSFARVIL